MMRVVLLDVVIVGPAGWDSSLKFHRIPADPDIRRVWIARINRADLRMSDVTSSTRLCSEHFFFKMRKPSTNRFQFTSWIRPIRWRGRRQSLGSADQLPNSLKDPPNARNWIIQLILQLKGTPEAFFSGLKPQMLCCCCCRPAVQIRPTFGATQKTVP